MQYMEIFGWVRFCPGFLTADTWFEIFGHMDYPTKLNQGALAFKVRRLVDHVIHMLSNCFS